ncbi:MAG: hypothetical protein KJO43_11705 [Phycisphaerae bacterium]|nr:hypothetical protein [Phycisphaerae bacterium]
MRESSPPARGDGSEVDLTVDPACPAWAKRAERRSGGTLAGVTLAEWRSRTRRGLGLEAERTLIATGHQTLLWHPGILVKYLLADAVATQHGFAQAHLVVDQHAGDFGGLDVPVTNPRGGGGLAVRRVTFTRPRAGVPMGHHPAFTPLPLPRGLSAASPSVASGVTRIHAAVDSARDSRDAAMQMASALETLMRPWLGARPAVTATQLGQTELARTLLSEMTRDPWACAAAYNEAVREHPEGGIRPLLVRDDYVELPLWRIDANDRRIRAYDSDVERWQETGAPTLMPRALFMTALLRLGMCDLFVHGTGGALYDQAMERWLDRWLGLTPAPVVVATANMRLPFDAGSDQDPPNVPAAVAAAHRHWHDPEPGSMRPGPVKAKLLAAVAATERRTPARRAAFRRLHETLAELRAKHADALTRSAARATTAKRTEADLVIAARRDWAFPLYPPEMIDALAAEVRRRVEVDVDETCQASCSV